MLFRSLMLSASLMLLCSPAWAHFGMVIPQDAVASQDQRQLELTLSFSHPFEMVGMPLEKPKSFNVIKDGKTTSLLDTLKETKVMDHKAWNTEYRFPRPGVYQFTMEPTPYWEPEEDCFIIHHTKTMVAAYGGEEGWDQPAGLATEIIPLTRPFGNYAGNAFSGIVMMDGKAVPYAEVEVEYYNQDASLEAPTEYHVTQVVRADQNGVFTYTCPLAGWWGFAALNTASFTLADPEGNPKPVELGAVLWIKLDSWKKR